MIKTSLELHRLDFFDRNRSNRGPLQKGKKRLLPLFADVSFFPDGSPLSLPAATARRASWGVPRWLSC